MLLFFKPNVIAGLLAFAFFGAQFLVQHFQILLIPELEQSSQRQSTALAIPGAKHTHNALLFMEIQIYSACTRSSEQIPPLSHRRQEGCGLKDMVASSECVVVLQKNSCFHAGWMLRCSLEYTAQPYPRPTFISLKWTIEEIMDDPFPSTSSGNILKCAHHQKIVL